MSASKVKLEAEAVRLMDNWRAGLVGLPAFMDIPVDRPRTAAGRSLAFSAYSASPALSRGLQDLARRHEVTLPTVLATAWSLLLSRLSGQENVAIIVSLAAGASHSSSDRKRGPAGAGVLHLDFSAAVTAAALLAQARAQSANDHTLPLAQLVEGLGEVGTGALQSIFVCASPSHADVLAACAVDACELVFVADDNDLVVGGVWYDAARFDADTLARYLQYFDNVLCAMVADDATPATRLPLLTALQRTQALEACNATAIDFPRGTCVHTLFEAQVARTPAAIAVECDGEGISYLELNARANRLAHHLRRAGVAPDDRVAIYVQRGVGMVIGLMATLKAGAAYVPLDPAYPVDRLAYTLQDSAPTVLLTQSGMEHDWRELLDGATTTMRVLDMVADSAQWADEADTDLACADTGVTQPNLAYVLYTSGSTGKPKGVAMPHGPLANLISWQMRQPGSDHPQRTLQFAALGFDVAFQEVFSTLCNGGTLCLIDEDTRLSGDKLFQFIAARRIERIFLPYFALQILAEGLEHHAAGLAPETTIDCALRTVITAGEQLRIEPKIAAFFQRIAGCKLHNHYGPTETHVVTALMLPDDPAQWPRLPTIGSPIANARVYVLDAHAQPQPPGVVGELYLAGPVVARCYLGRPDLSAERFLSDPFLGDDGARMYRTGDLGRWLPDGTIEFLGRKDLQVKIRGFRIELGEIEAQVMAFAGVREAAVLAREDSPGVKRLVAYVTPLAASAPVDIEGLRRHLVAVLPDYMVPVAYVALDVMPLSPNGKLDRMKLPAPGRERPDWAGAFDPPRGAAETALCRIIAEVLDLESIGRNDNFFDLGGSSLLAVRLVEQVRRAGLGELSTMILFRDPAPAALARALSNTDVGGFEATRMSRARTGANGGAFDEPIAIIAMTGRFPGAVDVETLWRNLCDGRDTVTHFGAHEIDASVPASLRRDPAYVPARGIIDDVELFDAAFFGISPKEAELMDPQQRIFLELCWECMERAGHVPDATTHPVGVFAGMYNASYYQNNVLAHPDLIEKLGAFQVMLDNEKDYIATRVAHKLNLTGPAISVHTACSTSLVAICQALESLRSGACDMALAGGIAITCPVRSGYLYQEGAMLSPDGHTRSFDADAQGTVFSDGAAVVLLKRLSDAIADGDQVHALICAGAINNDGGRKASFTAPSSEGQAAVIAMAHDRAGVDPRSIGYVETHGTATPLGDPIEIEGLTRAFRRSTQDVGFCRVGSVKSNVGHLLIAAGAAGVIKTALALRERKLPAVAHFRAPNPAVPFAGSPFTVNDTLEDWHVESDAPRRAGVSSFGVGGTNAHVVMEEAPARPASTATEGPQLLPLSARTPAALGEAIARLAVHLEASPEVNLGDVAWTLAAGRKAFGHRAAIAATTVSDAIAQLRSAELAAAAARSRPAHAGEVVFLFPGQGSQYAGMGRELYRTEPVFRDALDACADGLYGELKLDLRDLLFGDDAEAMLPTSIMQPAIFSIEYSLARLWMSRGVMPAAMVGHSIGEFVAATLAGVFELGDALRLVARRGRLMQARPSGAMLSVRLPLDALQTRLPAELSLAAENSPGACVVAGEQDAIACFRVVLEAEGIACRELKTSHAFHSAMMDAVVGPFRAEVEATPRRPPTLPIVSTATGDWLDAATAMSPEYWARHLREPVRFATAIGRFADAPARILLEVGPRTTLATLARQHPGLQKLHVGAVSSLADNAHDERSALCAATGQLWCRGAAIDLAALDRRELRLRLELPTYPFQRQRYWVEPAAAEPSNVIPLPAIAERQALEISVMSTAPTLATPIPADRKPRLIAELKGVFEDVAGFDLSDADEQANFIELGLDSLMLTQVALQLQKTFAVKVTFRQLMGDHASLARLSALLDAELPQYAPAPPIAVVASTDGMAAVPTAPAMVAMPMQAMPAANTSDNARAAMASGSGDLVQQVIAQQMQLMSQQLALLGGGATAAAPVAASASMPTAAAALAAVAAPVAVAAATPAAGDDEAALAHTKYDIKKAFGAIARIDSTGKLEVDAHQRSRLDAFMQRYLARTPKSKAYTERHRGHMADPRVVTGFRPLTKEIVYQIVAERSKGSHLWDIDGNEYVDALNGFGTSLFGWQPKFVIDAVKQQLEDGYEIGPQHPLAGEVAQLVCELTGHDRAALCNTGSEAVLGALRIARTVTGRETVVLFSGSYHGINDEVIVRGTRKLNAVPAAPGILRNTALNVLVLDYGTPESLEIIRQRAGELAAVLVEPVQSRRPDFQPVEFLKEVRKITEQAGAVLIFDEVITGFRSHPGGTQALFGIKADLATYGKVVGGGYPIGVMAGKREFMDALDGGHWQYGDTSVPMVGVTYFAGTFVRHPLTLAAAKASLQHMKEQGAKLQQGLNERTTAMAEELNAFAAEVGAPLEIRHFASMWRTYFAEDHPLQDLLFAMMRSRGIHILDNFPCFFTTAHSEADFRAITNAWKDSVLELQEAGMLPRNAVTSRTVMDADRPAVAGARLGRDPEGRPAWYVPNPDSPGKFMKVAG